MEDTGLTVRLVAESEAGGGYDQPRPAVLRLTSSRLPRASVVIETIGILPDRFR